MLRFLLPPPDTKLSRGLNKLYIILGVALLAIVFVGQLTDTESPVALPVKMFPQEPPVIDSLPGARLVQSGVLEITHPTMVQRLLAPSTFIMFDLVHSAWMIALLIVAIIYFRKFDYAEPFTRDALHGLRVMLWVTIAFFLVAAFRQPYYISLVQEMTGKKYRADFVDYFLTPEFWVVVVLHRVVRVFRKGYELSQETQYTV